jgi:ABC-type sugar transport system ATPase subunit
VQQIGSPGDVHRKPANLFVAAFIGAPDMSFFDGTLLSRGRRAIVEGPRSRAAAA